ncbi:hypothetical protein AWB99_02035 [Mycolicibacterium confluentis]|nr:hypothetical protein AWB99_02035 [Mycolicibacterium confluentis]
MGLYSWDELMFLHNQIDWLGLGYVRLGGDVSDPLMRFCVDNRLDVLVTVTPETERAEVASDGEFVAAYLARLDTVLDRYGPGGSFWAQNPGLPQTALTQIEIGNEPNFGYGFSGTLQEKIAQYAEVLIASYNHIKDRWPTVTVVGFATGGASDAAPAFIEAMLPALTAAGQLDCFDVMSLHPYSATSAPEQTIVEPWGSWVASESINTVKQLMLEAGLDKPLWITEVGYQISHADGGRFPTPVDVLGNHGTVTLTQQAAYTIRMNMAAARYSIPRVYHMFAVDSDDYNGGWFGGGPAHDPRPVADAMRQLIRLLHDATDFEVVLDGLGGAAESPYTYRFGTPRGGVLVAWCQNRGEFAIPLDAETETRVTDMFGNTIATVHADSYQGQLSEEPIYLFPASTDMPS